MERKLITAKEMQLGDVVALPFEDNSVSPFGHSTVVRIDEGLVHLARPYISISDFSCAGNRVIRYIGLEEYTTELSRDLKYLLVDRRSKPVD